MATTPFCDSSQFFYWDTTLKEIFTWIAFKGNQDFDFLKRKSTTENKTMIVLVFYIE